MLKELDIEFETKCKKPVTALRRFSKKFPDIYKDWGENLEDLAKTGKETISEENNYTLWLIEGGGYWYISIIVFENDERIQELEYTNILNVDKKVFVTKYADGHTYVHQEVLGFKSHTVRVTKKQLQIILDGYTLTREVKKNENKEVIITSMCVNGCCYSIVRRPYSYLDDSKFMYYVLNGTGQVIANSRHLNNAENYFEFVLDRVKQGGGKKWN